MFRQVFRVEYGTVSALLTALRSNCIVIIEVKDAALCTPVRWRRGADHVLLDIRKKKWIGVGVVHLGVQILNQNRVVTIKIIFQVNHVHLITRCEFLLKVRVVRSRDSKLLHV